ncbi:alpha/beta fold hydrolase [Leucobacter chromiiresistens]|uniref:AB hydrolase-1 domain-containing protein n=1 Tax=Leucobacter chromiiresistens TaxID=1079994 RepID=A0A147ERJ0_9MICO|nr:alpha/beta hydrolase [Leucobacter chromiiresistens]KTR87120.1 hypothetical protein NS354_02090 [Leucobacter chromiiresistens]
MRISGVDLYAETAGAGEPVVVLHGGFCSLESLAPIAEALAAEYRVHAYERPGHGRSADIAGEYDYDRGVSDALAFLDAHGLADAHVVGYSDGAIIGLLLAMRRPERVRSLTAISANLDPLAYDQDPEVNGPILPPLPPLPPLPRGPRVDGATGAGAEEDRVSPERAAYERLSPDGAAHADAVWEKCVRLWTTEPHIDPADLAGVAVPTLVLAGDRDTVRPLHTLRIAAALPNARLGLVPGTTHGLVDEKPELVTALVRDFLAEVARR